jgi:peptidyl-prolyl cis-trans isomerase D
LQDQNVVAIMTGEVEKGYRPLASVKEEITPAVRNELKGTVIIEKLNGMKGSLDEIKTAYGQDANVYSSSDLKLSSNSLPTVGFDPISVGTAFSLENGKQSKPLAGENGVVVMESINKTIAPSITDYSVYKNQLDQGNMNRSSVGVAEAIKDNAGIVDERYKFY